MLTLLRNLFGQSHADLSCASGVLVMYFSTNTKILPNINFSSTNIFTLDRGANATSVGPMRDPWGRRGIRGDDAGSVGTTRDPWGRRGIRGDDAVTWGCPK